MENYFNNLIIQTAKESRLPSENGYIQHGGTSCLLHSIAVSYFSYLIAKQFKRINFYDHDLIRGALLHDYFLYDWHEPDSTHRLHGFTHPAMALTNASHDFALSDIEKDIIKKHMFPLTPQFPHYKESLLVCLVDKVCSLYETLNKRGYKNKNIRSTLGLVMKACG